MSAFGGIPLPSPNDSSKMFDDVMDYWDKLKQQKTKKDEFDQNLANRKSEFIQRLTERKSEFGQRFNERRSEFGQNFGLRKEAQDRLNELLPYRIEGYKTREKREALQEALFNRLFPSGGGAVNPGILGNNGNPTIPGNGNNGNVGNAISIPASYADQQKQLQSGQEVLVKQPNKGKENWDAMAGQTVMGFKIPEVKSTVVDGIREDIYPSGKIIRQKEGPSSEEKADISLKNAESKAQAVADIKNRQVQDDYYQKLAEYADNNEAISDIMQRNPEVSGWIPGLKKYMKLGTKDLGSFNRLAVPMVGTLGKELSRNGGAVALRYASGGKFDPTQDINYNQGILEANNDAIVRDYNRNAKAYEAKFHRPPPYQLSQYYRDWEKKQDEQHKEDLSEAQGKAPSKTTSNVTTKYKFVNGKLVAEAS